MKRILLFALCLALFLPHIARHNVSAVTAPQVYLTFDDGPHYIYTEKILNTLKKHGVMAAFFVVGENAERNLRLIKRMAKEGHTVGAHCYCHVYQKLYSSYGSFENDLYKCIAAISKILPDYRLKYYRFPGGSFGKSAHIKNIVRRAGLYIVDWNCVNGDTEAGFEGAMHAIKHIDNALSGRQKIITLMHDNKKFTADTLDAVINHLKYKGCRFCVFN